MSRITARPTTGSLEPFQRKGVTSQYNGTSTPPTSGQAYSAIPTTGAQPGTGTGFYDASFGTYVGQKFDTSDGRTLTLIQNGAVAIGVGKLCQAPAEITAFEGLAMTVPTATPATAGTKQILVTNGATVLKANQYQQGYLITHSGTGAGQTLKIESHAAAAANAKFLVNLEDAILTTLDATTTIDLVFNPYISVIIQPHTAITGVPVGVTLYALAASTAATYDGTSGLLTANGVAQYGMIVSKGPTACLIDALTHVGYPVGPSTNVDGAVNVATLTTSPQIGISMHTQVDTDYGMIYLQL